MIASILIVIFLLINTATILELTYLKKFKNNL